ncbi:MAG TPA: DUF4136 domain-containing protein [Polyangiaceae bacterium LLY-WYZ-14_1]|nr:DUF4136 domain-containing protein [Polyangiaceae bacterium LLY-WYZ-14_1]
MFPSRLMAALLPVLLTVGCGSSLMVQHDTAADLTNARYQTYHLIEPHLGDAELAQRAVRPVLTESLEQKGYRPAPLEEAQVVVSYKVLTALASETVGNADEDTHDKTLIILFQDPNTWDILWVGWSQDSDVEESNLDQRAAEAARRIVATIPNVGGQQG